MKSRVNSFYRKMRNEPLLTRLLICMYSKRMDNYLRLIRVHSTFMYIDERFHQYVYIHFDIYVTYSLLNFV